MWAIIKKALNCWDEMESLIDPEQDMDVLIKVHARILAIDPGRCDTALFHARSMHEQGDDQGCCRNYPRRLGGCR